MVRSTFGVGSLSKAVLELPFCFLLLQARFKMEPTILHAYMAPLMSMTKRLGEVLLAKEICCRCEALLQT